jgi:hypothetical protein
MGIQRVCSLSINSKNHIEESSENPKTKLEKSAFTLESKLRLIEVGNIYYSDDSYGIPL